MGRGDFSNACKSSRTRVFRGNVVEKWCGAEGAGGQVRVVEDIADALCSQCDVDGEDTGGH